MKKLSILTVVLMICGLFAILVSGCKAKPQPGETAAEVHRRHVRVGEVNSQEFRRDVDRFFLTDKPSKLTDGSVRIP